MTIMRKTCGSLIALCAAAMVSTGWAQTTDLKSAIAAALDSHPEINQAIENKQAIEFEREQAQGLYLPRVSVEGSAGVRRLENATRRALNLDNETLWPLEASVRAEETLWDSGYRSAEKRRQAARTDGAALRVGERSQFVALNVTRQYLDYMLQQRVVAAAEDNIAFHRKLLGDLGEGVTKGSISIADQQQAEERLQAALVRKSEAEQDMTNAAIQFRTLTGLSIDQVTMPDAVTSALPPTLDEAIAAARTHNPLVREAEADIQAAHAVVDEAKSELGPTVSVEGTGRVGQDVDGFRGNTNDIQGRVVLRWQLQWRHQPGQGPGNDPAGKRSALPPEPAVARGGGRCPHRLEPLGHGKEARHRPVASGHGLRRTAGFLSRAVQCRPALVAGRSGQPEHPLQHAGADGNGPLLGNVRAISDPGGHQHAAGYAGPGHAFGRQGRCAEDL